MLVVIADRDGKPDLLSSADNGDVFDRYPMQVKIEKETRNKRSIDASPEQCCCQR